MRSGGEDLATNCDEPEERGSFPSRDDPSSHAVQGKRGSCFLWTLQPFFFESNSLLDRRCHEPCVDGSVIPGNQSLLFPARRCPLDQCYHLRLDVFFFFAVALTNELRQQMDLCPAFPNIGIDHGISLSGGFICEFRELP